MGSLVEARRRILLNTPHLESLSGSTLSFETDMVSKLKECRIHFTPIQEGSGDPSPDNVRPIVGWDGVTVNHNNNSITIPFPQTIYGGYVDLVKGEVVETHYLDVLSETVENLSNGYNTETTVFFRCQLSNNVSSPSATSQRIEDGMCDSLEYIIASIWNKPTEHVNQITKRYNNNSRVCMVMYNTLFGITDEDSNTEKNQKINAYLSENPIRFAYKLATPIIHQLTPTQLKALKGQNNIWSNANGNIEIKFWTH